MIATVALVTSILAAPPPAAAAPSDDELHRRAIVVDTHADTTQAIGRGVDIGKPQAGLHLDLAKMKKGGLDAQFFSIWVNPFEIKAADFHAEALRQLDADHAMLKANAGAIAWAKTAADVRANAGKGVLSALFGLEGGHALAPGSEAEQLARLRTLFDRGVRYMTLTWSNSNEIGGSSGDGGATRGLSAFGARVVAEMERLGMVVDISHVSDPTFWDVIRIAKKPVLATHSSSRALVDTPRNMTDEMVAAVGKNGGAVCVNFSATFLDAAAAKAWAPVMGKVRGVPPAQRRAFLEAEGKKLPPVPLAALVDHIDHVAKVAGIDHTCLGSDFDGVFALPVGMGSVADLPAITRELRKRGYAPADVEKILGGNTLRVLGANQPKAAR